MDGKVPGQTFILLVSPLLLVILNLDQSDNASLHRQRNARSVQALALARLRIGHRGDTEADASLIEALQVAEHGFRVARGPSPTNNAVGLAAPGCDMTEAFHLDEPPDAFVDPEIGTPRRSSSCGLGWVPTLSEKMPWAPPSV